MTKNLLTTRTFIWYYTNVSISQPDSENVNLEFELKTPLKAHVDMHDHIIKEIAMAATDKNKINGLKAS